MWIAPPPLLPEHSKCKEKGLAGLEPLGPMSPVSTAQAGDWAGANGHSQGGRWYHQGQAQDKVTVTLEREDSSLTGHSSSMRDRERERERGREKGALEPQATPCQLRVPARSSGFKEEAGKGHSTGPKRECVQGASQCRRRRLKDRGLGIDNTAEGVGE